MIIHKKSSLLPLLIIVVLILTSCGSSIPKDAFKLTPELLQKRVLKTRKYEGISEVDILSASAGVLQDLGFNIDESETKLGLIVGSKVRDATEIGQEVWWWIKGLLSFGGQDLFLVEIIRGRWFQSAASASCQSVSSFKSFCSAILSLGRLRKPLILRSRGSMSNSAVANQRER